MKAAIVGAGAIAREHLACLSRLDGVELAGVCDLSPAMAEAAAEEFGVGRWFTDAAEMLEAVRPDAVHVATPPQSHFRLAQDALAAGAHVLVEKPITLEAGELTVLQESARQSGRMLVEDHNYLFNRPVQELLRRAADGTLGRIVHVEVAIALDIAGPGSRYADPNLPHPSASLPGGAVADFLTHLAYLALAFVGPHEEVHSTWRKREPSSPLAWDEMRALVEAERGSAVLSFSARAQPDLFELRVQGTRQRARVGLWEPLLAVERVRGGPRPLAPVGNGLASAGAHAGAAFGGLWRKLGGRPTGYEGLHELVARFYSAAREAGEPPVAPDSIKAVQRLIRELVKEARP